MVANLASNDQFISDYRMLPQQQSPVVLDAITLNGIGSYIDGARLDIKPLTILAGSNGSGKSTWLKALNVLALSLAENRLPYGFAVSDWSPNNIQLTNAYHHTVPPLGDPQSIARFGTSEEFGSPGTIGLEFHATRDFQLSDENNTGGAPPELPKFLWNGFCASGTAFTIRLAHPTYWDDSAYTPHLRHHFELGIDGHVLRMQGERDPLQKFEPGLSRPRRTKPYVLYCSRSFLTGSDTDKDDVIELARFGDLNALRMEVLQQELPAPFVAATLKVFEKRLIELLTLALGGCYYVGAVRVPHDSVDVTPESRESQVHLDRRWVGASGEHAWQLERRFGANRMRHITEPLFRAGDIQVQNLKNSFSSKSRSKSPKLARLWEFAEPNVRGSFEALQNDPSVKDDAASQRTCVEFLNSVLSRRDFFDEDLWLEVVDVTDEQGDVVDIETLYPDEEIQLYCGRGVESLSETELRYLNYLLICNSLAGSLWLATSQECDFDEYLSSWLVDLFGVELGSKRIVLPKIHQWTFNFNSLMPKPSRPTPFLMSPHPDRKWDNEAGMARLNHSCFGKGLIGTIQPPRQLSAGFHQVFPILVQMGLLRSGELIGIENPEVHLHPSLQMKVAELLIQHAVSGRRIIVETHSDLVIRRIIRAILEESISQSQVQIYFVSLTNEVSAAFEVSKATPANAGNKSQEYNVTFLGSSIEPIRVDSRGRIANWPTGFLEADVQESQRLMDVMYGGTTDEDDDE